ncbi:hypothetical protein ACL02T_27195 [Pseudonocardia sp. RS010]|uniref:hypothetical protein n=1 Tax=Pseudonocardia sp. RS010 TaxID=3385979 RepID=UPI00399FCE60
MSLDDRGVRPLTGRERRILDHLERSLTSGPVPDEPAHHGDAVHRADRLAAVAGLLILCGMTAEAAVVGGPVLALGVGAAFVVMVVAFVLAVHRRSRH